MATYSEVQAPYGVETIIPVPYPEDRAGLVYGAIFWGDCAAEFIISVNGEIKAGARTSEADRTVQLDFTAAPIGVNIGDVLELRVTQYNQGIKTMKAVFLTRGT